MANRYFFDCHHKYSHAAWVLKEGSIRDALLMLESGLNLKFATETAEQRLHIILQKVANLTAPCLLIIDNANEQQDLVNHIGALRQCANFHVLITSRLDQFDGAKSYKIGALPLQVAKELFEQYYRAFNEEEAALFPGIYRAVDGNTLILQLLAKNLKKNRRKYFLPDLLTDLQERGVLDLTRSKKVVTDYGNLNEGEIEDIVAAMYDLGDLDEQQLKLLSVFVALPPEKILYGHLEILVTFLDDLDETLDELQQLGWVEENEEVKNVSYRCSPVVQAVVKKQQQRWQEVTPLLRSNIEDHIATYDGGHIKIGIKAARPFAVYGEAIAPHLPKENENIFFYQQLAHFYNSSGDIRTNLSWVTAMMSLAQELLAESPDDPELKNGLAISYEKLGETHSSLGNLPKALQFFETETVLFEELHAAYPDNVGFKNGLAISYVKLAQIASSKKEKITWFHKAEVLWSELAMSFPDYIQFQKFLEMVRGDLRDLGQDN